MTPEEEAVARFKRERSRFARAAEQVAESIAEAAREVDVRGRVSHRAKDVASFRGKVAIKRYSDPWRDVTDKCGVRMTLERDSDVTHLMEALVKSDRIEVRSVEDKRRVLDPAKLEYTGVHMQVVAAAEATDVEEIECEVQLRTAAQDLWSVVSHSLLYKPAVPLPAPEQHAVYRLVALTELFDLEVERIMKLIPSLPGYEFAPLLNFMESEYAGMAGAAGNRQLSATVLDGLKGLIPDVEACRHELAMFIAESRDELRDLFSEFGPSSEMSADSAYTLFSQPEALVILLLLEEKQMALRSAWASSDLPLEWLSTLAALSGHPLNPA